MTVTIYAIKILTPPPSLFRNVSLIHGLHTVLNRKVFQTYKAHFRIKITISLQQVKSGTVDPSGVRGYFLFYKQTIRLGSQQGWLAFQPGQLTWLAHA